MFGYPETPLAWGLTRGMADRLGARLTDAVVDGWLSRAELALIVERCANCGQTQTCAQWLAQARAHPCLPVFCPNSTALADLAIDH